MSSINFSEPHPAIGKTIQYINYNNLPGIGDQKGSFNIRFTDGSSIEVFNEKQFRVCYCPKPADYGKCQSVQLQLEPESYYSAGTYYTLTDEGVNKEVRR